LDFKLKLLYRATKLQVLHQHALPDQSGYAHLSKSAQSKRAIISSIFALQSNQGNMGTS